MSIYPLDYWRLKIMPIKDENKRKEYSRLYHQSHKIEHTKRAKIYNQAHKPEQAKRARVYYQAHKAEILKREKVYYQTHKPEITERDKVYYQIHKIEISGKNKLYYQIHRPEQIEKRKVYRQAHKTEQAERAKVYNQIHKTELADKKKVYNQSRKPKLKEAVLTHYGNGKYACVKCGCDDSRTLSIDHINGGGAKHKKSIKTNLYQWLKNNNYPEGYQTLCMNCQWIKRMVNNELTGKRKVKINKRISVCLLDIRKERFYEDTIKQDIRVN
jgi:hypothetical protein